MRVWYVIITSIRPFVQLYIFYSVLRCRTNPIPNEMYTAKTINAAQTDADTIHNNLPNIFVCRKLFGGSSEMDGGLNGIRIASAFGVREFVPIFSTSLSVYSLLNICSPISN